MTAVGFDGIMGERGFVWMGMRRGGVFGEYLIPSMAEGVFERCGCFAFDTYMSDYF